MSSQSRRLASVLLAWLLALGTGLAGATVAHAEDDAGIGEPSVSVSQPPAKAAAEVGDQVEPSGPAEDETSESAAGVGGADAEPSAEGRSDASGQPTEEPTPGELSRLGDDQVAGEMASAEEGSAEEGDEPTGVPVGIVTHPQTQTIEAGEPVTFTAAATGTPTPSVQWQRSTDAGTTWVDLRGATSTSYPISKTSEAQTNYRFRAVFTNSASPDGVPTQAATLTVTPRENLRQHCGASYGTGEASNGVPFCFRGPEKVAVGQDIVIEGLGGYLATDDTTGSVINFFLDAEYSGDPNTVFSKQTFTNPATGATISDRRTHAIVQADGDGTWTATVKWPTVANVSPTSDGSGSYTEAELAAKFGPGTTHSIRMLTGSLLASPPDRHRGSSLYFTIVASLDDETGVSEPVYEHYTFTSPVAGDAAVAWVPKHVESGSSFPLTGTGWLTKDSQWGSTIAVRLLDQDGSAYQRPAGERPMVDDPTVWQVVQAGEAGDLAATIQMPAGLKGGDHLAVDLTTTDDGTALGDVARHWTSTPLTIDGTPYLPSGSGEATCTAGPSEYSYELAPGVAVPAANIGGTIRLRGEGWCNLVGGGSLIAVKINAGGYQHLPDVTAAHYDSNLGREIGESPASISRTNKTIWYVIEADKHGAFDVQIPLPTRTNSVPAFGEGAYALQLLTRTISADPYYAGSRPDPTRTVQTAEFTVVAEGVPLDGVEPGKPTAVPQPLHAADDLTDAARGGVLVDQRKTRWVVTVPAAAPGDWVYLNVFDGNSPRFPWNSEWFGVDAAQKVTLPLAGATLPAGTNKLSVQDRDGRLLGWARVTVEAPDTDDDTGTTTTRPITTVRFTSVSTLVGQPKPDATPAQPVAAYQDLDEANAGEATAVESDGKLTVTIGSVPGGHWVYLYLYTETGRVAGIGWVQVGTDHTITVEIGKLPDGIHKLALVGATGRLLGWVTANGPAPLPAGEPAAESVGDPVEIQTAQSGPTNPEAGGAAPIAAGGDGTWTLILIGLAFLVLAGSAAGVITLQSPVRTRA